MTISAYETEILKSIGSGKYETVTRIHWETKEKYECQADKALAYIVYTEKETGFIQFGPCRSRKENCWITNDGKEDYWEVQPFPGAWVAVPIGQILAVRHAEAF